MALKSSIALPSKWFSLIKSIVFLLRIWRPLYLPPIASMVAKLIISPMVDSNPSPPASPLNPFSSVNLGTAVLFISLPSLSSYILARSFFIDCVSLNVVLLISNGSKISSARYSPSRLPLTASISAPRISKHIP